MDDGFDVNEIFSQAKKKIETSSIIVIVVVVVLFLVAIAGIIRLIVKWRQFSAGTRIAMLLVSIFVPFGGLWPLFARSEKKK
jgi:uncharacterized membrane protein